MKAITFTKYGSLEDLKLVELPVPKPGPNEVLVKIENSSNNAMDWHLFRGVWMVRPKLGLFKPKGKHMVLGADISGEVVEIGEQVTAYKKGDLVFGDIFTGGFAEYAIATENQLAHKPTNVSHEQAAAIPVAGMTALKAVYNITKVKPTDHILINGASGGVGTFTLQMVKHIGAKATVVCSDRNTNAMKSLGADEVINYEKTDFCNTGVKYDHIIDVVGNRTPREIKKALKPDGICAVIGLTTFTNLFRFMLSPSKQLKVVHVEVSTEVLNKLGKLLADGAIKSHITKQYPLADLPAAIKKLGTRRICGKQIITYS